MSDLNNREDLYEEEIYEGDVSDDASSSKKVKRAGKAKTEAAKGKGWAISFAVAMLAAFVSFIVLTVIQDRIVNTKVTAPVIVAIAEVPEGLLLNEANMATYFAIQERETEQLPAGITYSSATPIIGEVTAREIHIGELITKDCFKQETVFDDLEDGVELSLELGTLGQTVSGTLRAGDLVDLYAVVQVSNKDSIIGDNELFQAEYPEEGALSPEAIQEGLTDIVEVADPVETAEPVGTETIVFDENGNVVEEEDTNQTMELADLTYGLTGDYGSALVAENIRILNVFTSGGEELGDVEGTGIVATVVNVYVPRAMVESVLLANEEGTIYLVKKDEAEVMKELGVESDTATTATDTTGAATTTETAPAVTATPVPVQ